GDGVVVLPVEILFLHAQGEELGGHGQELARYGRQIDQAAGDNLLVGKHLLEPGELLVRQLDFRLQVLEPLLLGQNLPELALFFADVGVQGFHLRGVGDVFALVKGVARVGYEQDAGAGEQPELAVESKSPFHTPSFLTGSDTKVSMPTLGFRLMRMVKRKALRSCSFCSSMPLRRTLAKYSFFSISIMYSAISG